ncbi:MAG: DUF1501 domain-containing protein, partial [Planctomycetaceae bacterium]|nr:DUF1501 domain-containing protein [Planctomycetaceae bacterium]
MSASSFPLELSRRQWLNSAAGGFGMLALKGLLSESPASENSAGVRPLPSPHFAPRAKQVIFLCMRGGPSHMETFDWKPKLNADNGKPSRSKNQKLFGSQWEFRRYGESGLAISDLMPHTARHADQLCVLNGMHADSPEHAAALTQMHTGSAQFHRPSIGSWVLYGLGSENRNLPGFVSIKPPVILGGARNYASAFLPAHCQGTPIGTMSRSMKEARVANLENANLSAAGQREQLELVNRLNRLTLARREQDEALEGLIHAGELAFSMQQDLPALMDFSQESKSTLEMYGIGADSSRTDDFGRQCLLA